MLFLDTRGVFRSPGLNPLVMGRQDVSIPILIPIDDDVLFFMTLESAGYTWKWFLENSANWSIANMGSHMHPITSPSDKK